MTNRERELEELIKGFGDEELRDTVMIIFDQLMTSRRNWWASAVAWAIVFAITMYNIHTKVPCP